jgi:uncharacterized protein
MTFSLSGHNDSDGDIAGQTRQKSLREASAAYDLLRSRTSLPIYLAGNSYGGYIATLLTAEKDVAGLALRVPALYPDEGFNEQQLKQTGDNPTVRKWREQALPFTASRALNAVHDFKGPIQIIEAGLDERVMPQVIQNYLNAITESTKLDYHLMKDWPHSIGDSQTRQEQFETILLNWLDTKL